MYFIKSYDKSTFQAVVGDATYGESDSVCLIDSTFVTNHSKDVLGIYFDSKKLQVRPVSSVLNRLLTNIGIEAQSIFFNNSNLVLVNVNTKKSKAKIINNFVHNQWAQGIVAINMDNTLNVSQLSKLVEGGKYAF